METTEKTKRIPEDKKETPEDKFEIKAYLKTEFAQLYFPCLSAEAALKKLRKWIAVNPELHRQLYGGRAVWVRPLSMWDERVERDGYCGPRFTWVREEE